MLCLICGWCVCRRDVSVCLYLWSPCRLIKRLHPQPNFAWFISNGNLFQNITTHRQRCSHLLLLETKYPDMAALSDNIQLGFCFELINAWRMPRFYPPYSLLGTGWKLVGCLCCLTSCPPPTRPTTAAVWKKLSVTKATLETALSVCSSVRL